MALTKITNSAIADDIGLGGNPTTSTQTAGDSTTRIATTAFVSTAVANLVDSAPDTLNTLAELATSIGNSTTLSSTLTSSIATKLPLAGGTMTGNLNLGDNVKANFGLDSDLQIWHDGSYSYIKDAGTGDLRIQGSTNVQIWNANLDKQAANFNAAGAQTLYYDNAAKLATTTTGIDVTGNIGVSGTVDGIDIAARDAVLTSTTTTAGAALPKAGGTMTGALDVGGTITGDDGLSIQGGAGNAYLQVGSNTGSWTWKNYQSTHKLALEDSDGTGEVLNFDTSGNATFAGTVSSAALTVTGNSFIGNSSTHDADARLHVAASDTSPNLGSTTPETYTALFSNSDGAYGTMFGTLGSGVGLIQQRRTNDATIYDLSLQPYGGNVGIGTTAPLGKLSVGAGSINDAGLPVQISTGADGTQAWYAVNRNGSYGALFGYSASSTYKGLVLRNVVSSGTANADGISFITNNTSMRMHITGAGNVGIGTSNPAQNFVVAAATNGIGIELVPGTLNYIQAYNRGTSDYGDLKIDAQTIRFGLDNGAERVRIDSSGKVGIGTLSPSTPLHVTYVGNPNGGNRNTVEDVLTLEATGYYPYTGYGIGINFQGEDYGNTAIRDYGKIQAVMEGNSAQTAAGDAGFTSQLGFWTNTGGASSTVSTEKMTIKSTGNVGIGTTAPTELLHIKNPSNSWNQYAKIRIGTETSDSYASEIGFHRGTSSDVDRGLFLDGSGAGNQQLKVLVNGNVGIGTAAPIAPLHVLGNAVIETGSPDLYLATTSASHRNWRVAAQEVVNQGFEIASGTTSAGSNAIADTYTTRFTIKGDTGNVGIGTTDPKRPLQIGATNQFPISFNGNYPDIHFNTYYESGWRIHTAGFGAKTTFNGATGAFGFSNVASTQAANANFTPLERLTILANGNIGIGTTAPNAPLTVWTASSATSQSALRLNNPGGFSSATAGCEIIFSQDRSTSEDYRMAAISSSQQYTGSSAGGELKFWTRGSSSITNKMTLEADGTLYFHGPARIYDETTQGHHRGAIHLDPNSGTAHAGNAITWGASDHNAGVSSDAGIYVRSDGTYGTKMYISTTDSYAQGSQTSIAVMQGGEVLQPRQSRFQAYGGSTGYNPLTYSHSVKYPSTSYNIGSDYSGTTGLYTAPYDGYYIFEASIYSTATVSNGWGQAWLTINGGRGSFTDVFSNTGSNGGGVSIITTIHTIYLSSGDTVGYHPYTSSGSGLAFHTNVHHTWFRGRLIG